MIVGSKIDRIVRKDAILYLFKRKALYSSLLNLELIKFKITNLISTDLSTHSSKTKPNMFSPPNISNFVWYTFRINFIADNLKCKISSFSYFPINSGLWRAIATNVYFSSFKNCHSKKVSNLWPSFFMKNSTIWFIISRVSNFCFSCSLYLAASTFSLRTN